MKNLLQELSQGVNGQPVTTLNMRAARALAQLMQQAQADQEFRLKHQDMVVVDTDEAKSILNQVMNKEYDENCR